MSIESPNQPSSSENIPLKNVREVAEGEPASFILYHGGSNPFEDIAPDKEHPVVFYSNSPVAAASYGFANYRFKKIDEANKLSEKHPRYSYEEMVYGAKLLNAEEQKLVPGLALSAENQRLDDMRIDVSELDERDYHTKDILRVYEKLKSDPQFREEVRRFLELRLHDKGLLHLNEAEILDNEMGPTGSTREYMVTAENPAVFDYGGKTWGWFPDPNEPGRWWQGTRSTPIAELRGHWDRWLDGFFKKGHDVVIVNNIIDIGHELGAESRKPQTIVAVSTRAKVEMNNAHTLARIKP